MCNWFKKIFGCKCHCEKCHCEDGHCGCCAKEEEKPVENTQAPEVKPEVAPESAPESTPEVAREENVEQVQ